MTFKTGPLTADEYAAMPVAELRALLDLVAELAAPHNADTVRDVSGLIGAELAARQAVADHVGLDFAVFTARTAWLARSASAQLARKLATGDTFRVRCTRADVKRHNQTLDDAEAYAPDGRNRVALRTVRAYVTDLTAEDFARGMGYAVDSMVARFYGAPTA